MAINREETIKNLSGEIAKIAEVEIEDVQPDTKFIEELGMDSMQLLEVLATLEKTYSIKVPEDELANLTTLNNVIAVIEKYTA